MNKYYRIIFIALFCVMQSSVYCNECILTFDEAVDRVLLNSPTLRIEENEVQEYVGQKIQAKLYPNPIAAYSVENVYGNRNWHGWNAAESRYELAQLIELGGKRTFRNSIAKFLLNAAEAGYEATRLDLLNRLMKLFVSVVATQELLKIAQEQKDIAQEILDSITAKVEAGKISLIQQNKAEIALFNAENNLEKANIDFISAKERLSLLWGSPCPDFDEVVYPFFEIEAPKDLELCLFEIRDNPELIQAQYEHLATIQKVKLEKSNAIPDLTVSVGYKTIRDTHNKGMILGAILPIPLFNQNQGNIRTARAENAKLQEEYFEIKLLLESKLSLSHKELTRSYQEAIRLQANILRSADQSFEMAKEGYLEGKFEYLEMLDAQHTLFEVKENYIEALLRYHLRRAEIEYLTTRID